MEPYEITGSEFVRQDASTYAAPTERKQEFFWPTDTKSLLQIENEAVSERNKGPIYNSGQSRTYGGGGGYPAGYTTAGATAAPLVNNYMKLFNPATPPTFKQYPTFTATPYDAGEARRMGYTAAAPYVSQLRNIVNRSVQQTLASPRSPGQALNLRNVIGGMGPAIDSAMNTGAKTGTAMYNDMYKVRADENARKYSADVGMTNFENTAMQQNYNMTYQTALQNWLRSQLLPGSQG